MQDFFPQNGKKGNRFYIKKTDKENYHQKKSYHSLSLFSIIEKLYERIILQEATNVLEPISFLKNKNMYVYQKNKNTSKAILPLVENMNEVMTFRKYGIEIMADLEGAFDSVWKEGTIYKLYNA